MSGIQVCRWWRILTMRPGNAAARAGATLGVWNADLAGEPLRSEDDRLSGAKAYASGAGILSHALVTADAPAGRQMLLLDLARTPPSIDRAWWTSSAWRGRIPTASAGTPWRSTPTT